MKTNRRAKFAVSVTVVLVLTCFVSCMLDDSEVHINFSSGKVTGPLEGTLYVNDYDEYTDLFYETAAPHIYHFFVDGICIDCGMHQEMEELDFVLNGDKKSYSVKGIGSCRDRTVVIPSEYYGLPVTKIGDRAFYKNPDIENIIIPSSITYIGKEAFAGCDSLKYNIYENGCYLGNEENPYFVFIRVADKSVQEFKMHSDTRFIGDYAFEGCYSIVNMTLPDDILGIGKNVFDDCRALGYNVYENGLYLGNEKNPYLIFVRAGSLSIKELKINQNTRIIYDYSAKGCFNIKSVYVPENVRAIGNYAFSECIYLEELYISEKNESIGEGAFYSCEKLEYVYMPGSMKRIGDWAFGKCVRIKEMKYEGTLAKWNQISKADYWRSYASDFDIFCTDGIIEV